MHNKFVNVNKSKQYQLTAISSIIFLTGSLDTIFAGFTKPTIPAQCRITFTFTTFKQEFIKYFHVRPKK